MVDTNTSFTLEQCGLIKFERPFTGKIPVDSWPDTVTLTDKISREARIMANGNEKICEFDVSTLNWSNPKYIDDLIPYSLNRINVEEALERVVNHINSELFATFSPHLIEKYQSVSVFYESTNYGYFRKNTSHKREWRTENQEWVSEFLRKDLKYSILGEQHVSQDLQSDTFSRVHKLFSQISRPSLIHLSLDGNSGKQETVLNLTFSDRFLQPRFSLISIGTSAQIIFEAGDIHIQLLYTIASYMLILATYFQLTLSNFNQVLKINAIVSNELNTSDYENPDISLTISELGWRDGLVFAQNISACELIDSSIEGVNYESSIPFSRTPPNKLANQTLK